MKNAIARTFVGRCEDLLNRGESDIEGNDLRGKYRIAGAGARKKAIQVRLELFQYFIDIRSILKGRLRNARQGKRTSRAILPNAA